MFLKGKKNFTHGATLSITKNFLNETLELGISAVMNFNDFDSLINPSVNYAISDQIKIEAGGFMFVPGPEHEGQYGKYKDLSTVYVKAKYSF